MSCLVAHGVPFERALLLSSQGMAFTLEERLQLGIHGLLPPCFLSQDVQVLRVMKNYENKSNDLDKYVKTILFPSPSPFHFQFCKALGKTWGTQLCLRVPVFQLSIFSSTRSVCSGLSAVTSVTCHPGPKAAPILLFFYPCIAGELWC